MLRRRNEVAYGDLSGHVVGIEIAEMPDNFDSEYEAVVAPLGPFGVALEHLTRDLLENSGIRAHSVTHRLKRKDSTVRKLEKSDGKRSLASLTDLIGLRIITYFRDEVDKVAKIIEQEFMIDEKNSVDKRALLDPDRFGYLSLHYVAQIGATRATLPEYRRYAEAKFEIQIRSILQHAWAEIEHDLGYKSRAAVPRSVRRRFSRLAGLLELADDEFRELRLELTFHQKEASVAIRQGRDAEIDQDSLYLFVSSSEALKLIDAGLANIFNRGRIRPPDRAYIGRQAEHLISVGFQSIAEIDKSLNEERSLITEFCRNWTSGAGEGHRDASGMSIPAGQGLYYLYLARMAQILTGKGDQVDDQLSHLPADYVTRLKNVLRKSSSSDGDAPTGRE
jgi:ppGpp synthetase/RelA/SpoT-type nucleotidyltranferase